MPNTPAPPARCRPWREAPAAALAAVAGVLTDIDDTLTTAGAITPDALDALARLRAAGMPVVAITGRPLGWSLPFARAWPIDAIVAENGAVALSRSASGEVAIEYAQDAATRAANAVRLQAVAHRIEAEIPGARRSRDSAGRATDIAIDHAEFARLGPAQIDAVVAAMRAAGMTATVSSIHVNGWFGDHDKPSGARWIVERLFGRTLADEVDRWLYVGDSTNDQAMFGRFALAVGVANLVDFADRLEVWPAYLTDRPRGAGFAEVADRLLACRQV